MAKLKWTVIITAKAHGFTQKDTLGREYQNPVREEVLEVTEPDYYVCFESKKMAEIFADGLNGNRELMLDFVDSMWGPDYNYEDYISFKAEAHQRDWWPDLKMSKIEEKAKVRIREAVRKEIREHTASFFRLVRNVDIIDQDSASLTVKNAGYRFEQAVNMAVKDFINELEPAFESRAIVTINKKLDLLEI